MTEKHESKNLRRAFDGKGIREDHVNQTADNLYDSLTGVAAEEKDRNEAKFCAKCGERGHIFTECPN